MIIIALIIIRVDLQRKIPHMMSNIMFWFRNYFFYLQKNYISTATSRRIIKKHVAKHVKGNCHATYITSGYIPEYAHSVYDTCFRTKPIRYKRSRCKSVDVIRCLNVV